MSTLPQIYTDFHNADAQGRLRLTCIGSVNDLARQQVQLREGLGLLLYCHDVDDQGREARLVVEGSATYSQDEQCWVAVIDWQQIRHEPIPTSAAGHPGSASSVLTPSAAPSPVRPGP
jgi:hypothetical protein